MKFGRIIFFFVFILPFIFCVPRKSIFPEEDYKKLAGPPEEFPYFVIPQDSQTALISNGSKKKKPFYILLIFLIFFFYFFIF